MLRSGLLRNFRRVYRIDGWFRTHLTPTGYLVSFATVTAAVIGVNPRLTLAVQIFSLLVSLLAVAIAWSLWFRPRLSIHRVLPSMATAGEPLRYRLRVENRGKRRQREIAVVDELQTHWPDVDDFRRYHDPADRHRNPFDRVVGYPRWLGLIRHLRGAENVTRVLPAVPPGTHIEVEMTLRPLRRGYLRFAGYRLVRSDPFGLFNALRRYSGPARLLVLPRRYPLNPPRLAGGRIYQPGGVALAANRGDSEEFVSLRDYRPGDSLRDVHWRSWAKTGKPIVKEKRPEYFTRHALILDTCGTPKGAALFEEAVSVAASFACRVDTDEHLLDLLFVGEKAFRFSAGRGLGGEEPLLKILACVEYRDTVDFQRLHDAVLRQALQFSAGILVLLAWDDARRALVDALRGRGLQVLILVLLPSDAPEPAGARDVVFLPLGRVAEKLALWRQ
ncbi:MAG: DUF58 domain-containing protein [Gammaproteobacteria bacterium]|nr:DUF58 domain-containing protein [Gammaproteobacteria bacterium]MCP5458251.1 DUF58 domain-containing protein [Gammaproteobacteria bacterium]